VNGKWKAMEEGKGKGKGKGQGNRKGKGIVKQTPGGVSLQSGGKPAGRDGNRHGGLTTAGIFRAGSIARSVNFLT